MRDRAAIDERPVWLAPDAAPRPALEGIADCDVAIVGAGLVGLTAAELVSQHGLRVCMIEAGAVGGGATGCNAAGVAPIWGAQSPEGAAAAIGIDRAAQLNRALADTAQTLIERARSMPYECAPTMDGFLALAAKPDTAASLSALTEQWKRAGADVALLTGTLGNRIDSPRYTAGMFFAAGGTLNPRAYALGLARQCEMLGVRIFENSRVTGIAAHPAGGWALQTDGGRLDAAIVLVAVHGAAGLGLELDRLSLQIDCQLIGSDPLSMKQLEAMPRCSSFADLDDATVFGGTFAIDRRMVTTVLQGPRRLSLQNLGEAVDGKIARAFPEVGPLGWSTSDAGHILITPDKLPQLVEIAPHLYAGQGCNGYGLCAGVLLGEDLARISLSNEKLPARFPIARFRRSRLAKVGSFAIKRLVPLARRLTV